MTTNLVQYMRQDRAWWGVAWERRSHRSPTITTTAALIERGEDDWRQARERAPSVAIEDVKIFRQSRPHAGFIVRARTTAST